MAKKYIGIRQTLNIIERIQKKEKKHYGITAVFYALNAAKDHIKKLPAADVQEVKHGAWEHDEYDMLCCSQCKEELAFEETTPYCPYCGAKMDAGDGKSSKSGCNTKINIK